MNTQPGSLAVAEVYRLDPFDRQIVEFVLLWSRFGGPPQDELLPRFGLTVPQFNRRVSDIRSALRAGSSSLTDQDRQLLAALDRLDRDKS